MSVWHQRIRLAMYRTVGSRWFSLGRHPVHARLPAVQVVLHFRPTDWRVRWRNPWPRDRTFVIFRQSQLGPVEVREFVV